MDDGILAKQNLIGDPFIGPLGIEAIGAGKIDDVYGISRAQFGDAGLFVHGDTGKITYFLVKTGERVEQGAFPAVGVAY